MFHTHALKSNNMGYLENLHVHTYIATVGSIMVILQRLTFCEVFQGHQCLCKFFHI